MSSPQRMMKEKGCTMSKRRRKRAPQKRKAVRTAKPAETKADMKAANKVQPKEVHSDPEVKVEVLDEETKKAEQRAKTHKRRMRALRNLVLRVAALALVLYILFFHIVGILIMPSKDMEPRIDAGDLVLFYRLERTYHAQDVIAFRKPASSPGQAEDSPVDTYVCRVVAGPNDTVEITEDARLLINGNAVVESNIFYSSTPAYVGYTEYPIALGEGQYFVLSDKRDNGVDSRVFGVVNEEDILGVVITIVRRNNL